MTVTAQYKIVMVKQKNPYFKRHILFCLKRIEFDLLHLPVIGNQLKTCVGVKNLFTPTQRKWEAYTIHIAQILLITQVQLQRKRMMGDWVQKS